MIRVIKAEGMGNIQLAEVPMPGRNNRQVLVRTAKTLISRGSELFQRYIMETAVDPSIMGYSLTGVVEQVGSEVTELGADEVINTTDVDPVGAIKQLTNGRGAGLVIDCVGGYARVKSSEQAQEMVMVSSTIQLIAKYQQQASPSSR